MVKNPLQMDAPIKEAFEMHEDAVDIVVASQWSLTHCQCHSLARGLCCAAPALRSELCSQAPSGTVL